MSPGGGTCRTGWEGTLEPDCRSQPLEAGTAWVFASSVPIVPDITTRHMV